MLIFLYILWVIILELTVRILLVIKMKLGKHLTLDCFGCEGLDNEEIVKEFLEELPSKINMNKVSKVKIVNYKHEDEEKSGITGFVLIAESHISIHTYPKKSYMGVDVFSCKDFDENKVVNYVKEKFKCKNIVKNLISRGYDETNWTYEDRKRNESEWFS